MKIVVEAETLEELKSLLEQLTEKVTNEQSEESSTKRNKYAIRINDISVEYLPLPSRIINGLRGHNIWTIGQLASMTSRDLRDSTKGGYMIGNKAIEDIQSALKGIWHKFIIEDNDLPNWRL
jgi:DNA-directed RNA polymerase alpha subunit